VQQYGSSHTETHKKSPAGSRALMLFVTTNCMFDVVGGIQWTFVYIEIQVFEAKSLKMAVFVAVSRTQ